MMTWAPADLGETPGAPGGPPPDKPVEKTADKPAEKSEPTKPEPGPQPGDIVHDVVPDPRMLWHPKKISMVVAYHAVADGMGRPCYQIVEINETTLYKPGQWFRTPVLHEICMNMQWSVRSINYDYLNAIAGLMGLGASVGIHIATGVP